MKLIPIPSLIPELPAQLIPDLVYNHPLNSCSRELYFTVYKIPSGDCKNLQPPRFEL